MGKTPDQIRAEIQAARDQLAADVRGLSSQVHPSVIKEQTVQHVKDAVTGRVNTAKAFVVDDAGVRWDHIGTVVLVVAGVLLVHGTLHRIARLLFRR